MDNKLLHPFAELEIADGKLNGCIEALVETIKIIQEVKIDELNSPPHIRPEIPAERLKEIFNQLNKSEANALLNRITVGPPHLTSANVNACNEAKKAWLNATTRFINNKTKEEIKSIPDRIEALLNK